MGAMEEAAEERRLAEGRAGTARWKGWGPYLSERAWGTVREDYSADGNPWRYFPHDHARSRAYRWSEDGIAGISDHLQRLCLALALWNGRDPILKERLFGLANHEGNHGEDVKEYYFYLDATPTYSYLKLLYKYPQAAFPYADLVATNARRGRDEPEYEALDTGVFDGDRYFDVVVEYAKAGPDDILARISATNRGRDAADLHLLPTLWFRNEWSWDDRPDAPPRPHLRAETAAAAARVGPARIVADHPALGRYTLACEHAAGQGPEGTDAAPALLFCENETNVARLFGAPNPSPYVKDGIGEAVVGGRADAVNPAGRGTKAAAHYRLTVAPAATVSVRLRLTGWAGGSGGVDLPDEPFADFDAIVAARLAEADAFHAARQPVGLTDDARLVRRQALAGLLWSTQYYAYDVARWLDGDPGQPPPPPSHATSRNADWRHLDAIDVIAMPDKWEYPWFAAWDLAFQCLPLALADPAFAKEQLLLLGRAWYQHPNGQLPAYEWNFDDVNPPVQAWAVWELYRMEREGLGRRAGEAGDLGFLERAYLQLLPNFTWWVNREDPDGNNVFAGGFLGLDNVGVFDRSQPLPGGARLEQADGTSWMAVYALAMLQIALELAGHHPGYEDAAVKFFEHFLAIAAALDTIGTRNLTLWDEADGFFYDVLRLGPGDNCRLRVRSAVGLIPLCAVAILEPALLDRLPAFRGRLAWSLDHRPELAARVAHADQSEQDGRRILALLRRERLMRVLGRLLDEGEFLSPHGVRSLSRWHAEHPYAIALGGATHTVDYEPAESRSDLFGGNSNWRGPVWFPINYLIVASLRRFARYYGDDLAVECPTGSGNRLPLDRVADELARRLSGLFLRDGAGRRPVFGDRERFQADPHWRDLIPFHEYFHGDTGAGLGASHQTGWTALVALLLQ